MIPWSKPNLEKKDLVHLNRAFKSSWISGGSYIEKFEKKLKNTFKAKNVLVTSSGTTAIHLSYLAIGLKKGDEIKVTPYGGAWVNLLRNGAYNKVHNHPGAVWSAVYYVSLGRPDKTIPDNGLIEFMDPRPGNIHGGKEKIEPEASYV